MKRQSKRLTVPLIGIGLAVVLLSACSGTSEPDGAAVDETVASAQQGAPAVVEDEKLGVETGAEQGPLDVEESGQATDPEGIEPTTQGDQESTIEEATPAVAEPPEPPTDEVPAVQLEGAARYVITGDVISIMVGAGHYGPAESPGFDTTFELILDYDAAIFSGVLHLRGMNVSGLIQGEGPGGINVGTSIGDTDVIVEPVALAPSQLDVLGIPARSVDSVPVEVVTGDLVESATSELVGELTIVAQPRREGTRDPQVLLVRFNLNVADLDINRAGVVSDLSFFGQVLLTPEQVEAIAALSE